MSESYGESLRVAVEAAQAAGAILRDDFLKPGGPIGHDGHADADVAAERLIRECLVTASPDWSYLGEETDPVSGRERQHLWVVDPNDGTRAYLNGHRGSAVAIALLRDGVPVLGVVYAFAAPDNVGDLVAWAEGVGPLRRNGAAVERAPWAPTLTSETIVLVSQDADRAPAANLACVTPGRYLAVPSIAYRLALAAVGEGEVGVSLNAPISWDYAAGHALLRASGGALVNEAGRDVTYRSDGSSHTQACFGGAPALARALAARSWAGVFARDHRAAEPYKLATPLRGAAMNDSGVLERAQGCLLGQLAGDAMGSMVEFQGAASIAARYPTGPRTIAPSPVFNTLAGQPTDDSELALALARAILHDGAFSEEGAAAAYGYWRGSHPFDIGHTIGQATAAILTAGAHGESAAAAARRAASRSSESNGALMRQSVLAICGHTLDAAALDGLVRADTALTHPNRVCQDASAAFIVALAAVIGEGLDAEAAYARACKWNSAHGASPSVSQALAEARHGPPHYEPNVGHVIIALQNAFYQALHASSVEDGVAATVLGGGDTDTNAAIAGALLGALHGARAIPAQWRQAVLSCRPLEGASGVAQPRPHAFWPVDALVVAERLAALGSKAREGPPAHLLPEIEYRNNTKTMADALYRHYIGDGIDGH